MWDWLSPQNIPAILIISNFNLMWMALYVLVIRRGFLDKTFGIPIVALFLNSSWDVINTFIYPSPMPQPVVNLIYFLLELVIIYQVIRYWRSDYSDVRTWQFYSLFVLAAVLTFAVLLGLIKDFGDFPTWRASFIDTLINAALFIHMFHHRPDLRGQSLYIALLKLLGTAPLMLGLYLHPWPGMENSALLPALYAGIFILDLIYVILVYWRSRALGINPWRRV
jgi:hypothetical protein